MVGCNGIGKTTLLSQIKSALKKEKVPYIEFDNLMHGGSHAREKAGFNDDFAFIATSICSSEGENIVINLGKLASKLKNFIKTGDSSENDRLSQFERALKTLTNKDEKNEEEIISNERWILLDAIDSGLSVDNIVEVKDYLFKTILTNNFGKEIYIIVSANEYEMARNEQCFDVYNGKYVNINDYEEYRDFILKSREYKEKRYDNE